MEQTIDCSREKRKEERVGRRWDNHMIDLGTALLGQTTSH